MDYSEAQKYLGREVALKDWYRIITKPGTNGKVTSIIKTHQGEVYISVKLQDATESEEQFRLDAFQQMFRLTDHPPPNLQAC